MIGSRPVKVHAFGGLDYYGGDEPADKVCSSCEDYHDCSERVEGAVDLDYVKGKTRVEDSCAYSREIDVNDNAVVNVLYESGAKLSYTECHFTPDYVREFSFIGTKGRVRVRMPFHGDNEIAMTFRHRPQKLVHETVELDPGGHGGSDNAMLVEFVNAINENRPPLTDIHAGRECAAIAIAAEQSIETGQVVEIRNADGSPREVLLQKGRSRELSRRELLDRTPLFGVGEK
jgi:hypothetical protein